MNADPHLDAWLAGWEARHIVEEVPAPVALRKPSTYCTDEGCRTRIEAGRERCLHHSGRRYRDAA